MESAQTHTSRANQENVTSNNALCVNDSSSRGLCLQRKLTAVSSSNNVMQRKAWIITRHLALGFFSGLSYGLNRESNDRTYWHDTLVKLGGVPFLGSSSKSNASTKNGMTDSADFISGSGGVGGSSGIGGSCASSASSSGSSTNAEKYGSERYHDLFDDNGKVKRGKFSGRKFELSEKQLDVNTDHLQTHHRHILFDKPHNLKFGNHIAPSDNIGFGAGDTEEHAGLYSETDLSNYAVRNQISSNDVEDAFLVKSINSKECQNFGTYYLKDHNCQHWVNLVYHVFLEKLKNLKSLKKKTAPLVGPGSERRVGVGIDMIDPM